MKNRKRNPRNGRYTRDYTLIKAFLILTIIGVVTTFTMIGVNNIIAKLKTFEKLVVVENSFAEEEVRFPTWQEEQESIFKDWGIDVLTAKRVRVCESQDNPEAVNINKDGSRDLGSFQINDLWDIPDSERFDPVQTAYHVVRIVKHFGWDEWVTYNKYVKKGLRCPWVEQKVWSQIK